MVKLIAQGGPEKNGTKFNALSFFKTMCSRIMRFLPEYSEINW